MWHWIFYDGDWCLSDEDFDVYENATFTGYISWPTSEWSTLFFRKLIENESFTKQFLRRLEQLNSTCFDYKATKPLFSQIQQQLSDEIPQQSQRFNNPKNIAEWKDYCYYIDHFLARREVQFRLQTRNFFHLNDDNVTNLACFPNPARAGEPINLLVESESDDIMKVEVYDLNGNIVYIQHLFLQKGENRIPLEMSGHKGVYIVKMGNETFKMIVL
jgi:hypothetical protein